MTDQEKAIIQVFLEAALALNTINRAIPAIDIANELHKLHARRDDLELAIDVLEDYKLLKQALLNLEINHAV